MISRILLAGGFLIGFIATSSEVLLDDKKDPVLSACLAIMCGIVYLALKDEPI